MGMVAPVGQCLDFLNKTYQKLLGKMYHDPKGNLIKSCRNFLVPAKGESPFKVTAECDTGREMPNKWRKTNITIDPRPIFCNSWKKFDWYQSFYSYNLNNFYTLLTANKIKK